jgi:hypothetical protein
MSAAVIHLLNTIKQLPVTERLELHHAIDERVNRVIGTHADIAARVPLRTALARDDVASRDELTTVLLNAAKLRV